MNEITWFRFYVGQLNKCKNQKELNKVNDNIRNAYESGIIKDYFLVSDLYHIYIKFFGTFRK